MNHAGRFLTRTFHFLFTKYANTHTSMLTKLCMYLLLFKTKACDTKIKIRWNLSLLFFRLSFLPNRSYSDNGRTLPATEPEYQDSLRPLWGLGRHLLMDLCCLNIHSGTVNVSRMWRAQTEHTDWRVKSQEPPTEAGSGSERAEAERITDSLVFASLREMQLEARERNNSGRIGSKLPDPHIISVKWSSHLQRTRVLLFFLGGRGAAEEVWWSSVRVWCN